MSDTILIRDVLDELGIHTPIAGAADLSGGCIHQVRRVELADGRALVAKINSSELMTVLEGEADGLGRLRATQTVMVPAVLGVVACAPSAVLLMEALAPARATGDAWRRFGEELAALHRAPAGKAYGLDRDNHLGRTPQPNGRMHDWVQFNAERRLGHQLRIARDQHVLDRAEAAIIERVIAGLEELIPRSPRPALLHGDLWSGNAMPALDEAGEVRVAVIDPACSVGDGWADIAMMRLFGGFPPACHEAYAAATTDHDGLESRIAVYQLYHVLNHANMFGRGYVGQAMQLAAGLGVE